MTIQVPTYLRPLSRIDTGQQSHVDLKADDVEQITSNNSVGLRFEQVESPKVWSYEWAERGKTSGPADHRVKVNKDVSHPERHWWVISEGFLENIDPKLRDHADIFDLLISLNLCIEEPVFFSQSPGQVVGGAYSYQNGALNYMDELGIGNVAVAFSGLNEIPRTAEVKGDIPEVYEHVRRIRSKGIETDEEADIRVALHMYEDALSSTIWTAGANFYYVCENTLSVSNGESRDEAISDIGTMDIETAGAWREMVNRMKHPDKGNHRGLVDHEDLTVPSPGKMRRVANKALKQAMGVF